MNKKLSIFATILLIVGVIGSIYYGLKSIPYVMYTIDEINREVEKEEIIYNEELDINKLNIDTVYTNIIIKKHDKQSVKVVKTGINNESKYTIDSNNKELTLKEEYQSNKFDYNYKANNLKDLIKLFKSENKSIIVYVPNDVNLDVFTKDASLQVEDNVFLNDLYFKTIDGYISLPREVKDLKTLDIVSRDYIQLSMGELLGIENINIVSKSINIYSNDSDIFIEDIEKHIPNNINLNIDGGYIEISSSTPIANNLNIDSYNSQVELNIPMNKYKFNVNMKASENIDINNLNDDTYQENNMVREIKGTLNKKLDSLETEYNININAKYIVIYNKQ